LPFSSYALLDVGHGLLADHIKSELHKVNVINRMILAQVTDIILLPLLCKTNRSGVKVQSNLYFVKHHTEDSTVLLFYSPWKKLHCTHVL